jgi:hypothetical protein
VAETALIVPRRNARQKPKPIPFEIIRIGKKGMTLGRVYAATEEEAHAAAVSVWKIARAMNVLCVKRRS